jgi:hypothetical protein
VAEALAVLAVPKSGPLGRSQRPHRGKHHDNEADHVTGNRMNTRSSRAMGKWTPETTWKAQSLEYATFDAQLQKRTWRVPTVTLLKGRRYSFWVDGYFSS